MRRVLLITSALGAMLMGTAAPASATPPDQVRESGSYRSLFSYTVDCEQQGDGSSTCTEINLDAFTGEDGEGGVCLFIRTYVVTGDQETTTSTEFGCSDGEASPLTVTDDFDANVEPTTVVLTDEEGDITREVTVSAQDGRVGPITRSSGRGTDRFDDCTYRYSYKQESAEVAGTITIDGTTYEETGSTAIGESRFSQRCK